MFLYRAGPSTSPLWQTAAIACGLVVAGILVGQIFSRSTFPQVAAPDGPDQSAVADQRRTHGAVYPVDVVRINDGDTFEARVRIWPGQDVWTKVRLRGIDTPELNARCADEYRKAEAARDALRRMLAEGDVRIARVAIDKYGGRVLADVSTRDTPDVSAALLRAGHARAYAGGRRDNWCS